MHQIDKQIEHLINKIYIHKIRQRRSLKIKSWLGVVLFIKKWSSQILI